MDRILTPSKITAWLECDHVMTLHRQVDDGVVLTPGVGFGDLARLLVEKGTQHEADCLTEYRRRGLTVFEVAQRGRGESFASWVTRVGDPTHDGHDVIYQMPFIHNGIRGIADFVVLIRDDTTGDSWYEPVDAKLTRTEAKAGHVLQLCFYADALEALTGRAPRNLHVWLGSGHTETIRLDDVRPYWRRLRARLASLVADDSINAETKPEPNEHCQFCEFAAHCDAEWRESDSLVFVANIRRAEWRVLAERGIPTLQALAAHRDEVDGLRIDRVQQLSTQAALQAQARVMPHAPPPVHLLAAGSPETAKIGFAAMPAPDNGDVFLDFEGHPFWRADAELFFLFGLIERADGGQWHYRQHWAHDPTEEASQVGALIEYFVERRIRHPGMHVYHYNHTERSALERLAARYGTGEAALAKLIETGMFIDLLDVVRRAMQVGVESYGLKKIERLTDYQRTGGIESGGGAVVEYDRYTGDFDRARLVRIAAYNEDDVRATHALREWLAAQRPRDLEWRAAAIDPEDLGMPEVDAQIVALHARGDDTPEHLLGDLLGYWRREWRATVAQMLSKAEQDSHHILDDPDALTGLTFIEHIDRFRANGNPITPAIVCSFPPQAVGIRQGSQVIYSTGDGPPGFSSVTKFDATMGRVELIWSPRSQELAVIPSTVVLNDWVHPKPKPQALSAFADAILDPTSATPKSRVAMALLRRDLPIFSPGFGPAHGRFDDDLATILDWAPHLDESVVAIQGPPGTGKSYTGAHLVHRFVTQEKRRVGITAMSHAAIDNLLDEIIDVFTKKGDLHLLHAVRRVTDPPAERLPGIEYTRDNTRCAKPEYNLVAGTTWLFAGTEMRAAPVDVLIVDEAGQLCLADALAASMSAKNLILLGDPLQLAQVSKATHPGRSGFSVLQHIMGDDATIPEDRGVFLEQTRRMHPDVCRFISEEIYEGRLTSHPSCNLQTTARGTGLRWLTSKHSDCTTSSPEEADLIAAEIATLVGETWTNADGNECPLRPNDFMVVAPYNDQVKLLREIMDANEVTRGVQVGTVDKFQGQEAPVVFFSMTTSTSADMPRGPEFLFSRNRLNVAISRARCLAYLVCTEELLNTRARDIDEMKLLSTLCAFVAHSTC